MARRATRTIEQEPVKPLDQAWADLCDGMDALDEAWALLRETVGPIVDGVIARRAQAPAEAVAAEEPAATPAPPAAPAPPPVEPVGQRAFDFDAPVVTARAARTRKETPMPVAARAKRLSSEAVAVLDGATVDGTIVRLGAGKLERKLYQEVDAALAALGGKWVGRKTQGHVFDADPSEAIEAVVSTGEFVRPKDLFSFFETQPELADRLVEYAEIEPGMSVLEPSAGRGAIALRARDAGGKVVCVELDPKNVVTLRALFIDVVHGDFLELDGDPAMPPRFDRVIMNPPFNTPGLAQADIDHVRHAFELLKPGGRLVAVMGGGTKFRQNAKTTAFRRELLDPYCVIEEDNPPGTFAASGTGVSTINVVLAKPTV